jgi:outer membrane immunogenic protein
MHRITFALVAGAAVLSASAAFAADLRVPRPPPPVAAPLAVAPILYWNGCYAGGFLGGAWSGDVQATEAVAPGGVFYNNPGAPYTYELDSSFIAGGTLGCNIQFGMFVLGAEGEAGYLSLQGSAIDPNSVGLGSDTVDSTRVGDWYGVIAGRLGVAFGPTLIYVKGGLAFVDVSSSIVDNCVVAPCSPGTLNATGSLDDWSWALGAGIEYAFPFAPNWSIKAEYLHLGIDRDFSVCGPGGGSFCSTHHVDGIHTAKVGVNFRFGGPLVARY